MVKHRSGASRGAWQERARRTARHNRTHLLNFMRAQDQAAAEKQICPTPNGRQKWPLQVKFIVGNEACERFSYYGMKGILALFIVGVLRQTKNDATNIIALFSAFNYFMPMAGAWISERYWGRYRTILWVFAFLLPRSRGPGHQRFLSQH